MNVRQMWIDNFYYFDLRNATLMFCSNASFICLVLLQSIIHRYFSSSFDIKEWMKRTFIPKYSSLSLSVLLVHRFSVV